VYSCAHSSFRYFKISSDVGRLAREGDFDWAKIDSIFEETLNASKKLAVIGLGIFLENGFLK
jgi:hypothetical protein